LKKRFFKYFWNSLTVTKLSLIRLKKFSSKKKTANFTAMLSYNSEEEVKALIEPLRKETF
jgi:uncharacterized membrane protein